MQCSVTLVTLLDKLTRITPHVLAQNTSFFTQAPTDEIHCKQVSPQIFRRITRRFAEIAIMENLPTRELGEKAHTSCDVVTYSIFCMNFMEINLQERLCVTIDDFLRRFWLLDL